MEVPAGSGDATMWIYDGANWLQQPGGKDGADGADGTDGSDGLWTDNGGGSISYDGAVMVGGKNGEGLHFDLFGGDDYVIQESTSNDIMSFGAGTALDFTHNISNGTVTVTGDLLAAKADAGAGSVSVGFQAGSVTQGEYSAAFGYNAGKESQGTGSVGLGTQAGETDQSDYSVGIGYSAGRTSQGENSVAVGLDAAHDTQGANGVAIGNAAGRNRQGDGAVSLGCQAGYGDQGANSIAIGYAAGFQNQGANGIIINSSGSTENSPLPNHISIRSGTGKYLYYDGSSEWIFAGGPVTGINGFRQNGSPVIDAKGLISTLSTLRRATMDETQDIRESLRDAIDELVAEFEQEIAAMPAGGPQ
jgi:hypothetical protein